MGVESLGSSLQIDGGSQLVHIVHVVKKAGCPAPATYNNVLELGYFVQHVVLNETESLFAFLVEDFLDGLVHASFDIPVEVVEHDAQLLGKGFADCCLSGAHISDDDNRLHRLTYDGWL